MEIKDSGNRTQFYGADGTALGQRDIQEGKGRCDLLPLDIVAEFLDDPILREIHHFQNDGDYSHLITVLWRVVKKPEFMNSSTMILEVSKHFENGCKKYGENNWQRGIYTKNYVNSAVRHYLKWKRGDDDEPHYLSFVWNIMCCAWTCKNKPELNDYRRTDDKTYTEQICATNRNTAVRVGVIRQSSEQTERRDDLSQKEECFQVK